MEGLTIGANKLEEMANKLKNEYKITGQQMHEILTETQKKHLDNFLEKELAKGHESEFAQKNCMQCHHDRPCEDAPKVQPKQIQKKVVEPMPDWMVKFDNYQNANKF